MNLGKVSVITPAFGRADLLQQTIESVLNQTYKNVEIIVVDDNDNESEARKKTSELMEIYKNNDQVKYIKNPQNMGGCASRNNGVQHAEGKFIAFLDDDDYYLNDYIEKMVLRLQETDADMVYLRQAYCDDGKHIYASNNKPQNPEGHIFEDVLKGICPISIFFLLKKDIFESVNGFDTQLKGFQDFDLWMKVCKIANVYSVDEKLAVYRRDGRERITSNPFKREQAMDVVTIKWKGLLSPEQKKLFDRFCLMHKRQIELEKVIYAEKKFVLLKLFVFYIKHKEEFELDFGLFVKNVLNSCYPRFSGLIKQMFCRCASPKL